MAAPIYNYTFRALLILRIFRESQGEHVGADLMRATGLSSGSLYPLLRNLEERGTLSSRWEDGDPAKLNRPLKRLYQLTAQGKRDARQAFAALGMK